MTHSLTVYKASAGSGKTFTLTTEYIKLLLANPSSYRNILAVTFTNKATEEMKMRILSQLYGIWKQLKSSGPYTENVTHALGMSRAEASRMAGMALINLIHDYNYFRVETIDSFLQSIMRNIERELDLPANLRIELNDKQIEENAVDAMIRELDEDDEVLQWIMGYIMTSISDDKSWNIINRVKSFGLNIFKDFYKANRLPLDECFAQKTFFEKYVSKLRKIMNDSAANMKARAATFFQKVEEAGLNTDSFSHKSRGIVSYFNKLNDGRFSGKDCVNETLRKHLDSADAWVAKSNKGRERILSFVKDELMDFLEETEKKRVKEWLLYNSAKVTLKHLDDLRLLNCISVKVREINEANGTFLLSDTPQLLNALIDGSDAPFIFEKIGTRISNIMIDEFQDTSKTQWRNFKVLLNETMSHSKKGNIIVGDVKQSLYRWRDGDWRLLNDIQAELGDKANEIVFKSLRSNFRSERNIVSFNNSFFKKAAEVAFKEESAINPEYAKMVNAVFDDAEQMTPTNTAATGLVDITLLCNDNYKDTTLGEISARINMLMDAGIPMNKIAILVRENKFIPVIANYFMNNGSDIHFVSDEAFRLDASLSVRTIVQALICLMHPDDALARACLAKSYQRACGADSLSVDASRLSLPDDFDSRRTELLDLPLTELTERLFVIFDLQKMKDEGDYVCAFNDCVNSFATDYGGDVDLFLDKWDTEYCMKTIPAEYSDGIRITSIHKSKGLEFGNVILPFCDWSTERYGKEVIWCSTDVKPFSDLPLAAVDYDGGLADTVYADAFYKEHALSCIDNLNLLYVAFTRARNNLFIIGKRDARNTASSFIQEVMRNVPEILDGAVYEEAEYKTTLVYGKLSHPEVRPAQTEDTEETASARGHHDDTCRNVFQSVPQPLSVRIASHDSAAPFRQSDASRKFISEEASDASLNEEAKEGNRRDQYIKAGNILHYMFSKIRTADDVPAALNELQSEGLLGDDSVPADEIREILVERLSDERVKRWFSPNVKLFNECNIVFVDDAGLTQTRRPDRVVIDGKKVTVIDFKFGLRRKEHHGQVKKYMDLMESMGYDDTEGFLWYVKPNIIEEVGTDE